MGAPTPNVTRLQFRLVVTGRQRLVGKIATVYAIDKIELDVTSIEG